MYHNYSADCAPVSVSARESKRQYRQGKTLLLTTDIRLPKLTARACSKIDAHYESVMHKYERYAAGRLRDMALREYKDCSRHKRPFKPFELMVRYETSYNERGVLSIFYEDMEYTGGAHPMTARTANTWDVCKGYSLRLESFFRSRENPRREIILCCAAQAKCSDCIFFPNVVENMRRYYDSRNFYIARDGLRFYWQALTIAPYVTGIPTFVLTDT